MHAGTVAWIAVLACACGRVGFDGAAEGDDASPDASSDAVGDGGTSMDGVPIAMCSPELALCDTFEAPVIDGSIWMVDGDVTVDTTIAHRGLASLRMHMPARSIGMGGFSSIFHSSPLVTTASTLWVRAWFRISALPAATNALEILTLQQDGAQGDYVFVRSDDTQLFHQFDARNASAGTAPPVDAWFCLVWRVTLATTATGSSQLTSDLLPSISISNSQTQSIPPVDIVSFGPGYAPSNVDVAQPAFDVWVDDVIVDESPVSCDS